MPKPAKALDNMTKHLTKKEQRIRAEAEDSVMPNRPGVSLKPPAYVREDKGAAKYWRGILKRMEGISLLDDLDTEILAVYCSLLARRDATQALLDDLMEASSSEKLRGEDKMTILGRMDSLMVKLQGQERSILQYADKLGLTPSGRVQLARKRASTVAGGAADDNDLYGDREVIS